MKCKDLMTSDPACCVPQDTVVSAAMIMKNFNVGSVPVVLDRHSKRVIGMITDRDITLRVVADQRDYYNTHVEDAMTRDVVMCDLDDDYNEVIAAMQKNQIRRIPVVDSNKQLRGIIALADVARQAPQREQVGAVVEQISEPAGENYEQPSSTGAWYTNPGILVAGGLGLGAGLIYLLDPRWARRATEAVRETVTQAVNPQSDAT